jgi:hypothetical protein
VIEAAASIPNFFPGRSALLPARRVIPGAIALQFQARRSKGPHRRPRSLSHGRPSGTHHRRRAPRRTTSLHPPSLP